MQKIALGLMLWGAALVAHAAPPAAGDALPPSQDLTALRDKMDASKSGVDRETLPGAPIYHGVCQHCHEGQTPKAPARTFLQMMTPEAIDRALTVGIMKQQAAALNDADKRNVAAYLSGVPFGAPTPPAAPRCTGAAARFSVDHEPDMVGWGFGLENAHFIPGDVARLSSADIPRLKLKWAFAYPASERARSRPTFAYGALYVGSQDGTVYALDATSGCVRWTFQTTAEVRTPVIVPPTTAALKPAYFADIIGRVYALDATTGRELWRTRVEDHPSATITGGPAYYAGTLYVPVSSLEEATVDPGYPCCTFRGSVVALDGNSGKQIWKRYMIDTPATATGVTKAGTTMYAPSGAAVWSSPTVDVKRGLLYVGTGNNYTGPANDRSNAVLALDMRNGRIVWAWQVVGGDAWNVGCMVALDSCPKHSGPDFDIGSGVMLALPADRRQRLFIGLKSGTAIAIDAAKHDHALWSNRVGRGSIQGGIQFGMAFDGQRLYVPIADMGNAMDASQKTRTAAAGPSRPGLYALDPQTGAALWQSPAPDDCGGRQYCDPGILASIAAIPGAVFAGHMDGNLRAYDSSTGAILWRYDTTAPVKTLGGAMAQGGTIGGGGPVVHDGMLYTNSGYGLYFHLPGNLLLAFSVDGH